MSELIIPCDVGEVSDGYHTFNELYDHRCTLFVSLMKAYPKMSWYSEVHYDGSIWDGWLVCGMSLPTGDVTYHIPKTMLPLLKASSAKPLMKGKKWDGHTSDNVLDRIAKWIGVVE